jgi:hypothetical protein
VFEALSDAVDSWEALYVGDSDESYWELLSSLWCAGETFCIVEQDVIVRHDSLAELARCQNPWCAFPVPYMGTEYAGMACVKFADSLMGMCPNALDQVAEMSNPDHPKRHWCTQDAWLQQVLAKAGAVRCQHAPALRHCRPDNEPPWPVHGCHRREGES